MLGTDEALDHAAALLRSGKRVVGIGSSRATLEANYALRELVGSSYFFAGVNANEWALVRRVRDILQTAPLTLLRCVNRRVRCRFCYR
jgi:NADH-quinone oxidoreductase subunit G